MTSLRLLAVLDVLSSTPARAKRLAPRPDGPLTDFASPRGEKCRSVGRIDPNELEVERIEIPFLEFGDAGLDGIADRLDALERQRLRRVDLASDVGTVEQFALGEVEAVPGTPDEVVEIHLHCGHRSLL
ncbi:MAG: hypothetical protein OXH92_13890 [Bryobacterales bacterium]|nr:hypothetical protein [Bryobacterales bacterium]MDE0435088.1 hypothetical protein [Bryobacterales bacterium]